MKGAPYKCRDKLGFKLVSGWHVDEREDARLESAHGIVLGTNWTDRVDVVLACRATRRIDTRSQDSMAIATNTRGAIENVLPHMV